MPITIEYVALQETKQMISEIIDLDELTLLKSIRVNRMFGTGFSMRAALKG